MIRELVEKNRSYRRFYEDKRIDSDTLKELVELGRLSASGANLQPLKYIISSNPEKNAEIFSTCVWAGYLTDWDGPSEGERPSGYIIILGDKEISKGTGCDHGIAAQSILLGAAEKGIGGCMIGSIHRDDLRKLLDIPEKYDIVLILALGYPKETVVLESTGSDGSIKYYRDSEDVHHVPKRPMSEVLIEVLD